MQNGVPKRARAYVYTFLLAFVLCALAWIEAWPLTGWRLFSYSRTDLQSGWAVNGVDADGGESPLPFERFDIGLRGHPQLLAQFPHLSEGNRAEICGAWITEARRLGVDAVMLRIYHTEHRAGFREGARAKPDTIEPAYDCP